MRGVASPGPTEGTPRLPLVQGRLRRFSFAFGGIGPGVERRRIPSPPAQPCTRCPKGDVDRLGGAGRDQSKQFIEIGPSRVLQIFFRNIAAPDEGDSGGRPFGSVQEQSDVRVGRRARRSLRPQVEVGRHDDRSIRPFRREPALIDAGFLQASRQRLDAEVHRTAFGKPLERFPSQADAVAIDRIVGLLGDVFGTGQDRPFGGNLPPGAVQPAETLAECIEGRGLGHEAVEVEVHPDFQALGRDDEQRFGLRAVLRAGSEGGELLDESVPAHAAGSPDHQRSVELVIPMQGVEDVPRKIDAVDDDADRGRRHTSLPQPVCHRASGLGEGFRDGRGLPAHHVQVGGLVRFEPFSQYGMSTIRRRKLETPFRLYPRSGGQERRSHSGPPDVSYGGECLPERLGQMRLVQEDQAVGPEQAGMDGLHAVRHPVSAKQQPRADLIDGGAKDRRLRRRARPIVLQRRSAAKPPDDQRRRAVARQSAQPVGDFPDDLTALHLHVGARGAAKRLGNLPGSTERIVHHEAPVHDERNPQCGLSRRIGA